MKQRNIQFIGFVILLMISISSVTAQRSLIYTAVDQDYRNGLELFEKEKYGAAQKSFQNVVDFYGDTKSEFKTDAEYYSSICAIELFNKDAEYLIERFLIENPESQKVKFAYFQMGKFQFRKKKYKKAINWFEKVDTYDLDNEELSEYYFKFGYSYFAKSKFDDAGKCFYEIKDVKNKYTAPALYYYSHIEYLNNNYETAFIGFKKLSENEMFAPIVPYYISQIYYMQNKYGMVIEYAPSLLEVASTRRAPEIARIIGEAYYRKFMYKEATQYMEMYMAKSESISRDDYYQLGYSYYRLKDYKKSSSNFRKVRNKKDELMQNTLYHLGDCYLQFDSKNKAKMAFFSSSQMNFDDRIKEDALYNYAKLTQELAVSPFNDAIKAFKQYLEEFPNSEKRDEVYDFLSKVYLTTNNYDEAIKSLENINKVSDKSDMIYQRVTFFRGIEHFEAGNYIEAIQLFDKSLNNSKYNAQYKSQSLYWRGESYYRLRRYDEAITSYKNFISSAGAFGSKEYNLAHYNLGYCYYKKDQYQKAIRWFRQYADNLAGVKSQTVLDTYKRIGDCYYVNRNYRDAIVFYDKAIDLNIEGVDYAMFQKGHSLGFVRGKNNQKIIVLTELMNDFPKSIYNDDALYELGKTYEIMESPDMAINSYQILIDDYPESSYVPKAMLQQGLVQRNRNADIDAERIYKNIIERYKGTDYAVSALASYKRICIDLNKVDQYFKYVEGLGDFAQVSYQEKDSLSFIAAENMYMDGDCEKSETALAGYINSYQSGKYLLKAHYYKADCTYNNDKENDALSSYEYIVSQERNEYTETALMRAARIQYKNKEFKKAADNYKKLEDIAEIKIIVLEARVGQMRCSYKLKDNELAVENATKVINTEKLSPDLNTEAHYIRAKSLMVLDKELEAQEDFMAISQKTNNKFGAEAKYMVAKIYFNQEEYDLANNEVQDFGKKPPVHIFWLGKSFILRADVYIAQEDYFMAKAVLNSIIQSYKIPDDGILELANKKIEEVIEYESVDEEPIEDDGMEISFDDNENKEYKELFNDENGEKVDSVSTVNEEVLEINTDQVPDTMQNVVPVEIINEDLEQKTDTITE